MADQGTREQTKETKGRSEKRRQNAAQTGSVFFFLLVSLCVNLKTLFTFPSCFQCYFSNSIADCFTRACRTVYAKREITKRKKKRGSGLGAAAASPEQHVRSAGERRRTSNVQDETRACAPWLLSKTLAGSLLFFFLVT